MTLVKMLFFGGLVTTFIGFGLVYYHSGANYSNKIDNGVAITLAGLGLVFISAVSYFAMLEKQK